MSSFKSYWSSLKYHTITHPSINIAKKLGAKAGKKFAHRLQGYLHTKGLARKPGLNAAVKMKVRGTASKTLFNKGTLAGRNRRAALAAHWRAKGFSRAGKVSPGASPAPAAAIVRKPTAPPARRIAATSSKTPAARMAPKASVAPTPIKRVAPASTAAPKYVGPLARSKPISSVQEAVHGSQTHGQLRRRLRGLAVRQISRGAINPVHGTVSRKEIADHLRNYRRIATSGQPYKDNHSSTVPRVGVRGNKVNEAIRKVHSSKMKKAAKYLASKGL